MHKLTGLLLLAGVAFRTAPVAPATLTVTSYEFAFQAPDSAKAGLTRVRLLNHGQEAHQVAFFRLDDSSSLLRVMRVLVDNKARTGGGTWIGGIENSLPGRASEATIVLRPGRYVIVCAYDGADGHAHVEKGMLHALVVTGDLAPADTVLPATTSTIALTDYHIALSTPLHSGPQVVRVENRGLHPHHLTIARIVGNATMQQIDGWDGKSKPAPIQDIGSGAAVLDPGQASVIPLDLVPGRYLLACILTDGPNTKPHYVLGMESESVVH